MAVRRPTAINPDNFPRRLPGSYGDMDCPALNEEVLLADNKWIPAQDLKVGDKVATHLGSNKVTHIDVLKDRVKKEVVFSDNEKEESIVTSDSHPYYVQNEEGFVEVKDLKVGDQVGNFKVKEIKDSDKGSVVHISIDKAQTYYLKAGDKKVLSHNKSLPMPKPPAEQTIEGIPISQLPIKTIGGMPMPFGPRPFDPLFDPPRNQPRPIFPRKPKIRRDKKRGGLFGLRNFIRMLKGQRDMGYVDDRFIGMPRRPSTPGVDDGRVYAGGSPGLYRPGGRFYNPRNRLRKPLGLTQELPEVAPVGMMAGRTLQQDFPAERRMMMSTGDVAESGLMAAGSIGSDTSIEQQSPDMLALVEMARNAETPEEVQEIFKLMDQLREMEGRPQLAGGGDFPDLTGDGKVTQADILKGRGVYAEGDEVIMEGNEIDAMLGGMDSEVEGAMESMEDLEQMAPEMEMIDQLVTMVVQMIQQGASEEEIMMFLQEQGLDDEDIGTVIQLVAEMAEAEAMPQDGIGAELEQLA